jgi:hypothetical protein
MKMKSTALPISPLFSGVRWLAPMLALVLSLLCAGSLVAQAPAKRLPTFAGVSYGPHERNVLDFWQAKSSGPAPVVVFIHGGGFANGSKENLKPRTLDALLEAGISVVAVNYRYYTQAPLPAALHDCWRALQFVRARAGEWNLDKTRVAATGGSAGAIASMYLAFHDDMANPASEDPVERESTRLTAVATTAGQTTLDTDWWVQNVPGWPADGGAQADGHARRRWGASEIDFPKLIAESSALKLISADDPPIWMSYAMRPADPMPSDAKAATNWRVHHVAFGTALKRAMDDFGLESHLNHPGVAESARKFPSLEAFLRAKLQPGLSVTERDPENITAAVPLPDQVKTMPPPYPPSPVIADMILDWSTHERHALGSDNWQTTWANDGYLYSAWGDGGGVGAVGNAGRVGLGYARIEGDWNDYRIYNVWGGVEPENVAQFSGKSWGTISVDGVLYSWVIPDIPDSGPPRDHYRYIELARSTDHAATWTKANWRWHGDDNLIIPTFLVFGKDNAGARDGYIYSYFIRPARPGISQAEMGLEVHRPGAVFLARVPKEKIFTSRDAYEWFTGLAPDGQPEWGTLDAKQPVFENPAGTGWCLSASYNPGIGRYLLGVEHTASHSGVTAIFDAPEPWGPWTTVKYWTPSNRFGAARTGSAMDWRDNVFFLAFVPKWLSADGLDFTLVFTGGGRGKDNDSFNAIRGKFLLRDRRQP